MTWREAFLRQAVHEGAVWRKLNQENAPEWLQLHFLQMVTEKLAKGYLHPATSDAPPVHSHGRFVKFLQTIKTNSRFKNQLGYSDTKSFKLYIESLLEQAQRLQSLAPAIAGNANPNPEYPWQNRASLRIFVHAEYSFLEFKRQLPAMRKLTQLVEKLLVIAE